MIYKIGPNVKVNPNYFTEVLNNIQNQKTKKAPLK